MPAAHLDAITVDAGELDAAEWAGDLDAEAGGEARPATIDRETFRKSFVGMFDLAGNMARLQSLKVAPDEHERAAAAAEALYDAAEEVHWLRFLIEPGNVWVQRALVIGTFVVPKAMSAQAEVKARKLAAAEAKRPRGPAEQPSARTEAEGAPQPETGGPH